VFVCNPPKTPPSNLLSILPPLNPKETKSSAAAAAYELYAVKKIYLPSPKKTTTTLQQSHHQSFLRKLQKLSLSSLIFKNNKEETHPLSFLLFKKAKKQRRCGICAQVFSIYSRYSSLLTKRKSRSGAAAVT